MDSRKVEKCQIVFGNHECYVRWSEENYMQIVTSANFTSVTVRLCVSAHGMGNLHIRKDTINAESYIKVLE